MREELVIARCLQYSDTQLEKALEIGKLFSGFFKPAVDADFKLIEDTEDLDEDEELV